jgi:hypothetical protein
MTKLIELSKQEVETLEGILVVELNDLNTIQAKLKKSGQEDDFKEVGLEIANVSEILRKLQK